MVNNKSGYLYVLYDFKYEICKIGCTRQDSRKRQKSIIASNPNNLINLLNCFVEDRYGSENKCHKHFSEKRMNGEWFKVAADEVISYIYENIDWLEMDLEPLANIMRSFVINNVTGKKSWPPSLKSATSTAPKSAALVSPP